MLGASPLDDCLPANRKEAFMVRRFCYLLIATSLGLLFRATVSAQESFYKGKTIRIIVGAPPGGGYDTYSRLIARHIGNISQVTPRLLWRTCLGRPHLSRPITYIRWPNPTAFPSAISLAAYFCNSFWEDRGLSLMHGSSSTLESRFRTTSPSAYPRQLALRARSTG